MAQRKPSRPAPTAQLGIADPVIVKLVDPQLALPGETVVYTITVTNKGTLAAQNVVVTDTVPAVLQLLSTSTTQGTVTTSGNTATFNVGTVAPGQVITLIIKAKIRPDAPTPSDVTNTATMGDKSASALLRITKGVLPATGEPPEDASGSPNGLLTGAALVVAFILAAWIVTARRSRRWFNQG